MASKKQRAKRAVKAAKKHPGLAAAVAVIVILAIAVVLVLYFMKIGPFKPRGGEVLTGSETEIYNADLSIHFLELGNKYTGDCTLIKC